MRENQASTVFREVLRFQAESAGKIVLEFERFGDAGDWLVFRTLPGSTTIISPVRRQLFSSNDNYANYLSSQPPFFLIFLQILFFCACPEDRDGRAYPIVCDDS
jgi:hypothetical protein